MARTIESRLRASVGIGALAAALVSRPGAAQAPACGDTPAAGAQPAAPARTDAERSRRVDALFGPWARRAAPGVAVLVVRDGRVVHARGYGVADLATGAPITPRTRFALASLTKQFTAAAVLRLAEGGALSLDDPLPRHLPEFSRSAPSATVRQLLHHTAGVPDFVAHFRARGAAYNDFPRAERGRDPVHEPTMAEAVRTLAGERLRRAPGTGYEYSNSGYLLAATVVERVSAKPFPRYLREQIFAPLGMHSSSVGPGGAAPTARSYACERGRWAGRDYTPLDALYGGGGMVSTLEDLGRWYAALDRGSVVRPATARSIFASGRLASGEATGYGLGWVVESHRGVPRAAHGGWWKGLRHIALRFPGERVTVVILSNNAGFAPLRNELAYRAARIWFRSPGAVPAPARMDGDDLARLAGRYATPDGGTFDVRVAGSALSVRTPEGGTLRIHPLGGDAFFVDGVEEQRFRFARGAGGKGVRLTRTDFGLGSTVRVTTSASRRGGGR